MTGRQRKPRPPLTCVQCGRRYPGGQQGGHCASCHESFSADSVFDGHRVGRFEPMERRCLTPEEMVQEGVRATRARLLGSTRQQARCQLRGRCRSDRNGRRLMKLTDPDEHDAWLYAQQQVNAGGPRFEVILRCYLGDVEGEKVLADFAWPPGTGIEDVLRRIDKSNPSHRAVLRMLATLAKEGVEDYLRDVAE